MPAPKKKEYMCRLWKRGSVVGYDVTSSVPYGNVTIENGSKLSIDKSNGVIFKNGTECKLGGILEIK